MNNAYPQLAANDRTRAHSQGNSKTTQGNYGEMGGGWAGVLEGRALLSAPTFDSSSYYFSISESSPPGTPIATIEAQDADADITNYQIIAGDPTAAFSIDPSGTLIVAGILDYDSASSYAIDIQVTDSAGNAAVTAVNIDVEEDTAGSGTDPLEDSDPLDSDPSADVPTAVITINATADGIEVHPFNSTDPNSDPLTYEWSLNGTVLEGETLEFSDLDLILMREAVVEGITLSLQVSDGTHNDTSVTNIQFEELATNITNSSMAFFGNPPASTPQAQTWADWANASTDLQITNSTNASFVKSAIEKLEGYYSLESIPATTPGAALTNPIVGITADRSQRVLRYYYYSEFYVKHVPQATPAIVARLTMRARLQEIKQKIVDRVNTLLINVPSLDPASNSPIPLTQTERTSIVNAFADEYIRAVDAFLKEHYGARPMLGSRNLALNWTGHSNKFTDPWCADWAEGIHKELSSRIDDKPLLKKHFMVTDVQAFWPGGGQHNWVAVFPRGQVIGMGPLTVTPTIRQKLIYLDPWRTLLPIAYVPTSHPSIFVSGATIEINNGFG